jgi:hypothetical protein
MLHPLQTFFLIHIPFIFLLSLHLYLNLIYSINLIILLFIIRLASNHKIIFYIKYNLISNLNYKLFAQIIQNL